MSSALSTWLGGQVLRAVGWHQLFDSIRHPLPLEPARRRRPTRMRAQIPLFDDGFARVLVRDTGTHAPHADHWHSLNVT